MTEYISLGEKSFQLFKAEHKRLNDLLERKPLFAYNIEAGQEIFQSDNYNDIYMSMLVDALDELPAYQDIIILDNKITGTQIKIYKKSLRISKDQMRTQINLMIYMNDENDQYTMEENYLISYENKNVIQSFIDVNRTYSREQKQINYYQFYRIVMYLGLFS